MGVFTPAAIFDYWELDRDCLKARINFGDFKKLFLTGNTGDLQSSPDEISVAVALYQSEGNFLVFYEYDEDKSTKNGEVMITPKNPEQEYDILWCLSQWITDNR